MANNKYKLVLGLLTLISSATFAQMGKGYSISDSSVIPARRLPQQNEFWNNTYNFPAKPRNMVEVGGSLGNIGVAGDVTSKIPALGFELHIRKAIGYVFSLRLQYLNAQAKGLNWQGSTNYQNNPAFAGYTGPVYYNYKTHIQDLGIQGLFNLNNLNFHKQKSNFNVYVGAGIGATWYNAKVNARDANGNTYASLFNSIAAAGPATRGNRSNILNQLKAGMDNTYETPGQAEGVKTARLGNNYLLPSFTGIAGVSYKLSNKVNIALEDRHTFVPTRLLDGQQWANQTSTQPVLSSFNDSYNYLSLGVNVNLGAKAVEPLYWLNPLDYAYSELNNPKHMKLPKPILDDTDGDGVTDQLDREPNTPAGCPVDAHGVSRDTDGDGVPDCKDKQLITPTECQPVDADGVGKCPPPACCSILDSLKAVNVCATDYPSLSVKTAALSADTKVLLATVASKLKEKPNCTITIKAYPGASKAQQSLADKKLEAVKNYLVEKSGISADRVSVDKVIDGGDANTIDIKSN